MVFGRLITRCLNFRHFFVQFSKLEVLFLDIHCIQILNKFFCSKYLQKSFECSNFRQFIKLGCFIYKDNHKKSKSHRVKESHNDRVSESHHFYFLCGLLKFVYAHCPFSTNSPTHFTCRGIKYKNSKINDSCKKD